MTKIDKESWIKSISDSKSLAKQVLRMYMKSQSARKYTQILDEYFISHADKYDKMPDIKKVLEDWLEVASSNPQSIKDHVEDFLRYMPKEKQQTIMSRFLDSIYDNNHTKTIISTIFESDSLATAIEETAKKAKVLEEFIEPIDEFVLSSSRTVFLRSGSNKYKFSLIIENHTSVTKEHIKELIKDMIENDIIEESWISKI